MEAGKLNQKVDFYRLIVDKDEFGHETYTYEKSFSTKASIKYNSGNRLIENQEIFFDNTLTFVVRSYCPVLDTDRIKYRDKYYRILSVNDEYNNRNQKVIIAEIINT